ncbi:MAG: hypothetical protein Q7U82_04650 [Gammaproteobacteria bacterium]|nr:hypothetical protein [Gammaproteobacteria bacterium]
MRERTLPGTPLRSADLAGKVVLFIHGAGSPAEVAFDVPVEGYSWMAYLAEAGYDTFAMDTTGYGRSTRPHVMNDLCNLSETAQQDFIPGMLSAPPRTELPVHCHDNRNRSATPPESAPVPGAAFTK